MLFQWEAVAAIAAWGVVIVGLMTFLHGKNYAARIELKKQLEHLDECIDKTNKDVNALRLFMAASFSKQEIQDHWEKRDTEITQIHLTIGKHDSQLAVVTSEMAAARVQLERVINRLERRERL